MAQSPTKHDDEHETKEAPHTAAATTPHAAATPAPAPPKLELLVALLATDWLRGDKRHFAAVLSKTRAALVALGPDGADALAELDGMRA